MLIYYCWSKAVPLPDGKVVANIIWFRYDKRPSPIAPYTNIITGYSNLSPKLKPLMEDFVDEHFTYEETRELETYLSVQKGWSFKRQEVKTPVEYYEDLEAGRRTHPIRYSTGPELAWHPGFRFYRLPEEAHYNLSFQVWGYYSDFTQPFGIPPRIQTGS